MNIRTSLSLIVFVSSALSIDPAFSAWAPAAYRSEAKRAVQGCAAKFTDDTYMCIFVRCDGQSTLGLYAAAPGPDVIGPMQFVVDGVSHAVTFAGRAEAPPIPDATRASDFPPGLRRAMSTGRVLKIVGANLTPGYDTVSLKGAGPAIARIEKACGVSDNSR